MGRIQLTVKTIQFEVINMSNFDQFIQYRALHFKFSTTPGSSLGDVEAMLQGGMLKLHDEAGNPVEPTLENALEGTGLEIRNVCAKVPASLVAELDNTLSILQMKKRDFVEMALRDALERADKIIHDVGALEGTHIVPEHAA